MQTYIGIHKGKAEWQGNSFRKETLIVYEVGKMKTTESDFTWRWIDNSREGLVLNYGAGDIKYFENVWVRDHYLSGKLDGEIIMLTASKSMTNRN